jgi:hypothetical protein
MEIHDWGSHLWLALTHDWGWLWLLVAGVIVGLGVAMAYAAIRYAGRSRRVDEQSQAATKANYEQMQRGR